MPAAPNPRLGGAPITSPGIVDRNLAPYSGLAVRSHTIEVPWMPDLCTCHRGIVANPAFPGANPRFLHSQDTGRAHIVSAGTAKAQPIVNTTVWKEIKITHQNLPFPVTPVVRVRETAGSATYAVASTGGVSIQVKVQGVNHLGREIEYEMPDPIVTLPNNVVGIFADADNRGQDSLITLPLIFSKIYRAWYKASGVHAGQDFLDIGVAMHFDASLAQAGVSANDADGFTVGPVFIIGVDLFGPALGPHGLDQPSFRFMTPSVQAIGLPMELNAVDPAVRSNAGDTQPWTLQKRHAEILSMTVRNNVTGEIVPLSADPGVGTGGIINPDVIRTGVQNGDAAQNNIAAAGGYYQSSFGAVAGNPRIVALTRNYTPEPGRVAWFMAVAFAPVMADSRDTTGTDGYKVYGLDQYNLIEATFPVLPYTPTQGRGVNGDRHTVNVMYRIEPSVQSGARGPYPR